MFDTSRCSFLREKIISWRRVFSHRSQLSKGRSVRMRGGRFVSLVVVVELYPVSLFSFPGRAFPMYLYDPSFGQ